MSKLNRTSEAGRKNGRESGLVRGGMERHGVIAALVAAAGMLVGGSTAYGQYGPAKGKQPAKNTQPADKSQQPAAPGQPGGTAPAQPDQADPAARKPAPKEGPYITKSDEKSLTLNVTVNVRTDRSRDRDSQGMPVVKSLEFKTLAVVFPLLSETGSSRAGSPYARSRGKDPEGQPSDSQVRGELLVDDQVVCKAPTLLESGEYQSGVRLGRWDAKDGTAREVTLKLTIPMTCYQTALDEKAAKAVGWPKGEWPKEAALTFKPQMYVNEDMNGVYDMTPVQNAVKEWTNGQPQSQPPVVLAKYLAGQVMEAIQPSGNGLAYASTGEIEGIGLVGGPYALQVRRGSDYDAACALVACYREAGLPARTVIGYAREGADDRRFLKSRKDRAELRVWVEFCLYDELNNTVNWVPVDIVQMRKKSSQAGDLNRPWPYFGTHDQLNEVAPFAFQFHPPTTVLSYGSPGFWGWMVTPKPPTQAFQTLRFEVTASAARGGEPEKREKKDEKKR